MIFKNKNSDATSENSYLIPEADDIKKKFSFSDFKKFFKHSKGDDGKVKNDRLLKKGGYSIAITAIVLAGLIVFNWLIGSLSDRFHLELDITSDKKNSISEENIDYIKSVDTDVNITICADEEQFENYMSYYAQNYYGVYCDGEYFKQTATLIQKYQSYNDKISVKYVDPQSTEYTAITSNYSSYSFAYGDILVTAKPNGKEQVKVLRFSDIYVIKEDSSSSYYGGSSSSVTANKLESSLTSAIDYVTSAEIKKAALITGHSKESYADAYTELLTANNYELTEISDAVITDISSDYDIVIISAPSTDFLGSELDIISEFLDNDGKLGKGLIFFADATCPALPNLYSLLSQWGISVGEGILFETNSRNYVNQPSTMGVYTADLEDDDITTGIEYAVTDYNVPMTTCEPSTTKRTTKVLMQTLDSAVAAPVGSPSNWNGYTDSDKKQYDSVIQAEEAKYDDDNNRLTSYIMAFSSVEFVQSTWASYSNLGNQDIVLACTSRAAHKSSGITFTSKVITNESFASDVKESGTKVVRTVFIFIIPAATVIVGIYLFIRRKNAQ